MPFCRLLVGSGDVLGGWCVVVANICCHRKSSHFVGSHYPHSRTKLQHDWRNMCTLSLFGTFWYSILFWNRGGVKKLVFVALLVNNKSSFHCVKIDHIITGFEVRASHDQRQLIFTTDFSNLLSKDNTVLKLVTLLRVDELLPDVFIWTNILTLNRENISLTHELQWTRHVYCAMHVKNKIISFYDDFQLFKTCKSCWKLSYKTPSYTAEPLGKKII